MQNRVNTIQRFLSITSVFNAWKRNRIRKSVIVERKKKEKSRHLNEDIEMKQMATLYFRVRFVGILEKKIISDKN